MAHCKANCSVTESLLLAAPHDDSHTTDVFSY